MSLLAPSTLREKQADMQNQNQGGSRKSSETLSKSHTAVRLRMQTRWSSASTFRLPMIQLEGRCRRPSRIHPMVVPAVHVAASRGKTASASPCSAAAQLVRRDRRAHSMLRGRRGGRGRVRQFRMAGSFKIQNAPSHLALPTKSKNDGRSVLQRPIVPCCSEWKQRNHH